MNVSDLWAETRKRNHPHTKQGFSHAVSKTDGEWELYDGYHFVGCDAALSGRSERRFGETFCRHFQDQ